MAARRQRRGAAVPTRLGDLVQQTAPGKAASSMVVSRNLWEQVAGVGFARRTQPTRLDRGTLWVDVASSGWAQELALAERVIVERLVERGVAVQRLRCVVREVARPDRGGVYAPPRAAIEAAQALELSPEVARAVQKVRDPELREVIAKTARSAARRQAEVDLKEQAARVERAIPRVPGSRR